ncbi:bromodomain adjacent to zinc finger domain protein 1A [Polypterus senegalus]|uniref:bromodomain adjacent to zinc finger domain protein 1A n=1 Tax=Polypterus senegalus TaxID=55291 RepID=UPI00196301EE|nr:bromodomain adjacent to zinc finger domain protein 1A [Polypterus senegalus]
MPLLHRKPFVRRKVPSDLRLDEEVFHCKFTNEIFRDYDEFFERTILCNSLVWSCAVTGKPGLTYQEAVDSEKRAKQNLQNFPEPLILPVLYLTTLTHRSRLHEICDDVFAYMKDRFFVGETVDVTSGNGSRQSCKILEVISPIQNGMVNGHSKLKTEGDAIVISDSSDEEEISKISRTLAVNGKKKTLITPSLFKYRVCPVKLDDYEPLIVQAGQISRRKNVFSRDRLKLLLKQHCEFQSGVIKVKAAAIGKYKLLDQNFFCLFPDEPPTFECSVKIKSKGKAAKRPLSAVHSDCAENGENAAQHKNKERANREIEKIQKQREEMRSLAIEKAKLKKEKADAFEAKKREKEDKEKKREELKKLVEVERLKKKEEKERLKVEKEKEREKLREEKRKYAEYLKQWSKRREDMECDDLKMLPSPLSVKTRLPPDLFGDALMVLEFLHAFGELFDLQDEFPEGVTLEVLEEALVGCDPEGPLCELLFFFLTAIFEALAEEQEEVAKEQLAEADAKDLTEALDEEVDPTQSAISAVAAFAAAWPQLYQGCSLKQLDLDSCTLSEILRLHILASGADATSANAKYRYQKQGGFGSMDDACVELRLSNPALLKKLSTTPVYDLLPGEKLKILHALCGKLLTLVSTRDFIEDNAEILRQAKQEFRELKAEQNRRGKEEAAARVRKKKVEKLKEQEMKMKEKHEKLKEDEQRNCSKENQTGEEEREEMDTSTESQEASQIDAAQDTATEDEEESEMKDGTKKNADSNRSLNMNGEENEDLTPEEESFLREEMANREKELMERIQKAAACTYILPLGRDRLYRRYWLFTSAPALFVEEDYSELTEDMLLPQPARLPFSSEELKLGKVSEGAAPPETTSTAACSDQAGVTDVEKSFQGSSKPVNKPNHWSFYSSPQQFEQLLDALNSRGRREHALKEALLQEKDRIVEILSNCPLERFHMTGAVGEDIKPATGKLKCTQIAQDVHAAEKRLEMQLRDFLLDIEDRIYQGTLGMVKAVDRPLWRTSLESGQYDLLSTDSKENGFVKTENCEIEEMEIENVKVGTKDRLLELKSEGQSAASTSVSTPQPVNNSVHYLALALLQIEQGIERKFLRAPLGDDDVKRDQKGKKKDDRRKKDDEISSEKDDSSDSGRICKTVLDRWRESLLTCSSLSQVFLHLSTLDRSIIWSKSILNARCKMCRKKGDAENMMMCDGCNRGHHIFCVRPKLKLVPEGDWFCPECKPKQRARRLSSRQRSSVDSEDEEESSDEEEEEEEDQEDEEDEEDDEEGVISEDEEEECTPKRGRQTVKLSMTGRGGKSGSLSAGRGSQRQPESGRSTPRSRLSTPKSLSSGKTGTRNSGRKVKITPVSETKPLRSSGRTSARLSLETKRTDGSFIEQLSYRYKGKKSAESTPENSPVLTLCTNKGTVKLEKRSSSLGSASPLCRNEPSRRGRKRKSADASLTPMKKNVNSTPVQSNRRSSSRNIGVHELSACEQIIVELVRHEDSWPFIKLVSKAQVPDYYDIIHKPIALSVIREKMNSCKYSTAAEFVEDVELMFTNCYEYNARNTAEAKAGVRLQAFFHSQAQKNGLEIHFGEQFDVGPAKKSRI